MRKTGIYLRLVAVNSYHSRWEFRLQQTAGTHMTAPKRAVLNLRSLALVNCARLLSSRRMGSGHPFEAGRSFGAPYALSLLFHVKNSSIMRGFA